MGHTVFVLTVGTPEYEQGEYTVYKCGDVPGPRSSIRVGLIKGIKMGLLGRKLLKKHRIDIIHAHDPNISTIAHPIMDPFGKIPSMVKYSGDLAWELIGLKRGRHADDFWNTPTARTLLFIERILFRSFTRVVAQSNYHRNMLKNVCHVPEQRLIQVPNGINIYEYSQEEIESARRKLPEGLKIGSSSRLVSWKGVEFGIKGMKHINGSYIVIGDGPERGKLEKLAKDEGVAHKVVFLGRLPHEEVQLYLRCCDVMLVTSLYEPFGISILDGFASGVPVVGSRAGGIIELVEPELLFESRNIDDLVKKINWALENRSAMVERQNEKLQRYLWKNIARSESTRLNSSHNSESRMPSSA
jgi:glycosyltransferase involved in cell wall biosynthesis